MVRFKELDRYRFYNIWDSKMMWVQNVHYSMHGGSAQQKHLAESSRLTKEILFTHSSLNEKNGEKKNIEANEMAMEQETELIISGQIPRKKMT